MRVLSPEINLACFDGVVPDEDNMNVLAELAHEIGNTFTLKLSPVVGFDSSWLEPIIAGGIPARVYHACVGEAIIREDDCWDDGP